MQNKFLMPSNWMLLIRALIFSVLFSLSSLLQADALLLTLRGVPAPGALLIGQTVPGVEVLLGDKTLTQTADGYFVLGFGRDESGRQVLTLRGKDQYGNRQEESHEFVLRSREWRIQRVEGVPQETVTPPAERLERIRKEGALVASARRVNSSRRDFLTPFVWPASGPITGVYGSQRVYNGEPKNPHYGVDIAGPKGAPVIAPAGGKVTLAHPDMFYSGGTLLIDHGHGISSTFIHLSKVLVKEGQEVKRGEMIGEIGASGRATGPHLDWRMNWFKTRLDPQWFMSGEDLQAVQAGRPAGAP
jgi:murein DD-endopeptidase MepM/ murein hydrolase activator NlpD